MKFEPIHHVTAYQLALDGDSAEKMEAYRRERDRDAVRRHLARARVRL